MLRDVDQLTARAFDLLVVGGGIYGLAIARDAATRGLSVALVERDDFGGGSSFNHLRTIHGGLRYLQNLDISRARESIRERRTLARIAPQTLRTTSFAVPLTRSITRGRLAFRAGFLLDRILGSSRNTDVVPSLHLPAGRIISRAEAIERFPGMRRQGLTGAAVWHDYVTTEPDRLTFSWAVAAAEAGAAIANYVEATDAIVEGRRVIGVRAIDRSASATSTGSPGIEIRASVTVNASGAGLDRLLAPLGLSAGVPLIKAMNLVTRREAGTDALAARAPSGRHLILVPWRGRALFGTWESARLYKPDERGANEDDVAAFIGELNQTFPALDLTREDVTLVHRGLVPASVGPDGTVSLEAHERIRDHAGEGPGGIDGIVSVAGTKYTTARAVAERVTDQLLRKLRRPSAACRTTSPLPGATPNDPLEVTATARHEYDATLPSDTLPHLVAAYGSGYGQIAALAAQRPEWRVKLSDASPVIGAQIVWAVRHEMAMTLSDAVIRRTPLGALGYPGDAAVDRAAAIVAAELHWNPDRVRSEIDALKRFYGSG
jgi:glycerol-3-phosphate dehydrogenase